MSEKIVARPMTLRYFVRLPAIACAESEGTAARLLQQGYKECPRAYYMRIWQLRDEARQATLEPRPVPPPAWTPTPPPPGFTRFGGR